MIELKEYILVILSYIIGSIPFGFIIGRLKNIDIKKYGSGNIGATNVSRVLGKKLGILTLLFDCIKGIIPLIVATKYDINVETKLIIALSSVIGHIFPIWLKFSGGKAVATSIGVILYIDYRVGIFLIIIWILIFLIFSISSLSSIIAFLLMPFYSLFICNRNISIWLFIISAIVITKHKSNISRIIKKEESKFK